MKKIFYLLAALIVLISACQKQPNLLPTTGYVKSMNLTLAATDYQLLPTSVYANTALGFYSYGDANSYIPTILAARDPQLSDGSKASVTFNLLTPNIKLADSVYKDVTYTISSADYTATGNNYGDITASGVYKFLAYKYPTPQPNQLVVLTYILYAGGTDTTVTNSFLYVNGAWTEIYQISPAQYTFAGEGKYDQFQASDNPHLLSYFNYFLKNDATIADTVNTGDVEYISFSWYASGDFQRVQALTYNGSNWTISSTQATLPFIKSGGAWTSNGSIYHTLNSADIALIAASSVAPSTLLTNLGKYGDFESGSSGWTTTELDAAFILVLQKDYPTPKTNTNYVITYLLYNGGDVSTQATFQWSGSAWTAK
jgi:hypothetical protein